MDWRIGLTSIDWTCGPRMMVRMIKWGWFFCKEKGTTHIVKCPPWSGPADGAPQHNVWVRRVHLIIPLYKFQVSWVTNDFFVLFIISHYFLYLLFNRWSWQLGVAVKFGAEAKLCVCVLEHAWNFWGVHGCHPHVPLFLIWSPWHSFTSSSKLLIIWLLESCNLYTTTVTVQCRC